MDWSITLVNSSGALITGASALTTLKIRRVSDDFLLDWDDLTFKGAGWGHSTTALVEVSAVNVPGLYKKTVVEAAWSDGDYQGIVRYAPVAGTPINGDMVTSVRDGKEIEVRIGDVVEALPSAAAVSSTVWTEALPGAYTAGMAGKIVGDNVNAKVSDAIAAPATALTSYGAAKTSDVTASQGVITGAIGALNDLSSGDAQTAAGAALTAYDAATGTDVTTSQGVVTGAISGLNNLSSAQAQAAAAAALTAYDAATGTDVSSLNNLSSAQAQAAAAAALTAYDAATGTDVSTSEGVITGAISGLNDLSSGDVQTAAGAALTAYDAATGTDISSLNNLSSAQAQAAAAAALTAYSTAKTSDVTTSESNIRGADSDTLKTLSDQIDGLPTDLDVQAAAAAALTAYDAATGTDISSLNNLSSAQAQAAAAAALTAYDAATGTDVTTSEGVITGAISGLNDISTGDVQTAAGAALTAYDAATGTDISALNNLSSAQAQAAAAAALTAYDAATGTDVSTSEGVITGVISGLNDVSTGDVQTAAGAALTAYDAATGTDIADLNNLSSSQAQAAAAAALTAYDAATGTDVTTSEGVITAALDDLQGTDGDTLQSLSNQLDILIEAAVESFRVGASMSDDGVTSVILLWGERGSGRDLSITNMVAAIRSSAGAVLVNLGAGTGPDTEGCFKFSCSSLLLPYNNSLYITVVATDGLETFNANLGVTRVR